MAGDDSHGKSEQRVKPSSTRRRGSKSESRSFEYRAVIHRFMLLLALHLTVNPDGQYGARDAKQAEADREVQAIPDE
jgi:hypothetical protein